MPAIAPTEPARERRPTPALDAALAEIAALHSPAAEIDRFKRRCRHFIWLFEANPMHPAVFARYYARARLLRGWSTAEAADWVACRYANELARWRSHDARLNLMVLRELRLIVRFMRAHRIGLAPVIADVLGEDRLEAAE